MDIWPEFLYGNKTIDEYLELVKEEKRDMKREIVGLVDLIYDITKYPYTPQQNLSIVRVLCQGIRGLVYRLEIDNKYAEHS